MNDNNTQRNVVGLLGLAAVVGTIYTVFKGTEKPKGLGDLNTAKTKSGRVKQRKAVFAKMEEAGTLYNKNRKGKRTKRLNGLAGNLLKTRKTSNGYTVNLLKIGTMYYVQTLHEKRRGYKTRYAGTSEKKAEKAFAK